MTLLIDTREPWPHPWAAHWPADVRVVRGTMETCDVALAALPERATVERKTVPGFLAAMGKERERPRPRPFRVGTYQHSAGNLLAVW